MNHHNQAPQIENPLDLTAMNERASIATEQANELFEQAKALAVQAQEAAARAQTLNVERDKQDARAEAWAFDPQHPGHEDARSDFEATQEGLGRREDQASALKAMYYGTPKHASDNQLAGRSTTEAISLLQSNPIQYEETLSSTKAAEEQKMTPDVFSRSYKQVTEKGQKAGKAYLESLVDGMSLPETAKTLAQAELDENAAAVGFLKNKLDDKTIDYAEKTGSDLGNTINRVDRIKDAYKQPKLDAKADAELTKDFAPRPVSEEEFDQAATEAVDLVNGTAGSERIATEEDRSWSDRMILKGLKFAAAKIKGLRPRRNKQVEAAGEQQPDNAAEVQANAAPEAKTDDTAGESKSIVPGISPDNVIDLQAAREKREQGRGRRLLGRAAAVVALTGTLFGLGAAVHNDKEDGGSLAQAGTTEVQGVGIPTPVEERAKRNGGAVGEPIPAQERADKQAADKKRTGTDGVLAKGETIWSDVEEQLEMDKKIPERTRHTDPADLSLIAQETNRIVQLNDLTRHETEHMAVGQTYKK